MLERIGQWLTGTLRRQLVVGTVLVVATMMSLFVWDLTRRQESAVLEQQSELAVALARSVATSSSVWVASRDFSGLQEIVNGLTRYPDLRYAIVLDSKGQVLAHSDVSRRGLYLNDLPARPVLAFIGKDAAMVDVASPILLAGHHIGWVRIGLGQQSIAKRLDNIRNNGIFYALIAVVLAAILSTLAARRLTRRLYGIQSVADAVQAGRRELRADIVGVDEAAQLARQFNGMLDTLAKSEAEIVVSRDALIQSEARLNQVMAVTGEGIWDWDLRTNCVMHNPSWCAITGLEDSHIEDPLDTFSSIVHEDDRTKVMARMQDCLDGKGKFWSEYRMHRADGRLIWVQDRGDVVERDAEGRPVRMLGSIADITERKRFEEKLVNLNQELEQRVEKRTADMKAALDQAEQANAAKSEFLSRMSHELRTPLNAVIGFGQLLETDREQPLTAIQIDNVREILHAGGHLLELINEVLDLSRIESGRLEVSIEAVAITPQIETCVAQLQPLAAQRRITFALESHTPCAVQADRLRLRGVLLNLLSNAIKYNREGGKVQISYAPAAEQRLRISVRDSGRGIGADALPRLFKPFERLESAYEGIEGTGIGLALAKNLVLAMRGEIGVESMHGEGSTFWFELPLAAECDNIAGPVASPVAPQVRRNGRRKILYVEDNPANLRLVQKILATRKDIDLLDAVSAEAGLEIAASQLPDIILLDIQLPGMDGFEALRRLREHPATRKIPVIAVSANAMPRGIERGLAAGFDDYLTKPVDVAQFFDILERSLPICTETIKCSVNP